MCVHNSLYPHCARILSILKLGSHTEPTEEVFVSKSEMHRKLVVKNSQGLTSSQTISNLQQPELEQLWGIFYSSSNEQRLIHLQPINLPGTP